MKIRAIIFIVLFGTSWNIDGQEVWSLEKCVNYAIENNLDILLAQNQIEQAQVAETQAIHGRYPTLNGNLSVNSNFGRSIDPVTNQFLSQTFLSNGFSLTTGVALYNGGQINNRIKQAKKNVRSAEYTADQARRDISLAVANAYLNVLFAKENVAVNESQLRNTEEQLTRTNQLIAAGNLPENERLNLEAQLATNEQNLITVENNIQIALLNLKALLMLEPTFELDVVAPEDVTIISNPDELGFDRVYESAIQNQPQLVAQQLQVESAEIGKQIAKGGLYPSVTIGGSLQSNYSNRAKTVEGVETLTVDQPIILNGEPAVITNVIEQPNIVDNPYFNQLDENLAYGFGLNMRVPIYNNYNVKASIQQAELNVLNAKVNLERQKNQLATTVQQALADARAAKRQLVAAEKSVLAQQAAYDNANLRQQVGNSNTFELANLQNQYQQAQINEIIAKYQYIFATKVIDFYMGQPIRL